MSDLPPSFYRTVIDDSDPSFQYGPSWTAQSSASRDQLNSGPAFDGTLHTTSTSTSFSVKFSGSDVAVYSSVSPVVVNNVVQADPQWECIVDGNSLGVSQISSAITTPQNNINICDTVLSAGAHELVVKVTSKGTPFWVDDVQYTPLANADLSNTVQKVYKSDPNLKLSSDFTTGTYGIALTQKPGGTATFTFSGTSLSWVGYIFSDYAKQSATATWSVDGSTPVSFDLPTSDISYGNTVFFTTPTLSSSAHTLVVTYQGDSNSMPLALDYFFVTNGAGAPSGGGSSGGGTSSSGNTVTVGGTQTVTQSNTGTNSGSTAIPASTTAAGASTNATTTGTFLNPSGVRTSSSSLTAGSALETSGSTFNPASTVTASKKSNTGSIVGGVVGGLVVVALLVIAFFLIKRRRRTGKSGIAYEKAGHYRDFEQDGSG